MQRLRLYLEWVWDSWTAAQHLEAVPLVADAMAAAAAGGELRDLQVHFGEISGRDEQPPVLSTWLRSSSLQSLKYGADLEPDIIVTSLEGLPALRELSLGFHEGSLQLGDGEEAGGGGLRFPATLTKLELKGGLGTEGLPSQVGCLGLRLLRALQDVLPCTCKHLTGF